MIGCAWSTDGLKSVQLKVTSSTFEPIAAPVWNRNVPSLSDPPGVPCPAFSITVVPPPAAVVNFTLSSCTFWLGRVEGDWRKASMSVT